MEARAIAIIFIVCAAGAALGSLVMLVAPIFLIVAFLGVPIGFGSALIGQSLSQAPRGPLTAQSGVAGVVAGAVAAGLLTGVIGAALVFLVYVGVVGYVVYVRLR